MRAIFDAELQQLGGNLIAMAKHVEGAIGLATDALLSSDMDKAQSVIAEDKMLDELEALVDEQCVLLIAQQQPVGLDLRTVIAALRISASLERMGDLAQHIAEAARRAYPQSAVPDSQRTTIEAMSSAARRAAAKVVELLESRDLNVAADIVTDDDDLDTLHRTSYDLLLDPSYEGTTKETLDIALLARFFERFGDHAVGVSRRIVYLVTGDHTGERTSI